MDLAKAFGNLGEEEPGKVKNFLYGFLDALKPSAVEAGLICDVMGKNSFSEADFVAFSLDPQVRKKLSYLFAFYFLFLSA